MLAAVGLLIGGATPTRSADATTGADKATTASSVPDFGLFDHRGDFHRLHYHTDDPETRALVLFIQGNGCPLVRKRVPILNRLQAVYEPKGVRFWMLNANPQDTREEIAEEARRFDIRMPVLIDDTQFVARALQVDRTAEVLVIDPRGWQIRYRGAIDDQLEYETAKPAPDHAWLADALDAVLADRAVPKVQTDSPGCRITFLDPPAALLSDNAYAKVIAPLILDHCVRCHQPGGIAPFALSSHRKVRGWADMIREVLLTRRMPPWQADPAHGEFANDFSLSGDERRAFLQWLEAGAPAGTGGDPLAEHLPKATKWTLGTPDHVLEIPDQKVPAEGIIDYRYLTFTSPFERDVWVRAMDVQPGDHEVLHHLIAYILFERDGQEQRRWLAGYAPGSEAEAFPTGTAIRLGRGEKLLIELHYTASGRATVDRSRVAFYLTDDPSPIPLRTGIFIDQEIRIPPGARAHPHRQEIEVRRDGILFSLFPHMHFRGRSMRFGVRYPDRSTEILLSVPAYNFNWQRGYHLKTPKRIPAGSTLFLEATWDNSALNPANPDPTRTVTWGEQSFDEMFFGTYRYVDARAWDRLGRSSRLRRGEP